MGQPKPRAKAFLGGGSSSSSGGSKRLGNLLLPVLLLVLLAGTAAAAAADEEKQGGKPKPFWPLMPREWAGIVLSALALTVAGGSGIGAGGMMLPLFILMFDLSNTRAAALTRCTVMVSRRPDRQVSRPRSCQQR